MPQQWLVKRPQEGSGYIPPVTQNLPSAILGTPVLTTSFSTDENHQLLIDVTIPISFANGNAGDVDRLITHLLAPDTSVDTQEAFVGGPGVGETPGIIIGDATQASKVVELDSTGILVETPWDPDRPFVHFTQPVPTQPEWWRAIVVSASKATTNKVDTSPSVRFHVLPTGPDVNGLEYAPLGLNFHLRDKDGKVTEQPVYDTLEGGVPVWGFHATWENDTKDPRFPVLGGYDLDVQYPDGSIETHASKSSNDLKHDSPMWTFGAPGNFIIWLVSWSSQAGNPRNSRVADLTPSRKFYVSAPTGPTGKEYAANVIGFRLTNPYYAANGQGQKTLYLPFEWSKPDDRAYSGCIIVMIRSNGTHYPLTGLETDDKQTCELQQFPAPGLTEDVVFYAKSVSLSGDVNSYIASGPNATPSISVTLNGPPDTTPKVTLFTATIVYAKDDHGNNVYGYSGTWANPNKAFFPEYQGVKIVKVDATDSGRVDLTGIQTGTSFATDMWPVPSATTVVYLKAVSVDTNGNERPLSDSPRAGPLFITPQGGTITNDSLPDLDVSNFAAGVEPVTFVNAAKDPSTGLLPASVTKQTTTVFNNNDQRLYRWDATVNRYKVVGTATDLDANSITTGYLAAGSVTTLQMASREILVGPLPINGGPNDMRPPIFKVENAARSMVGFFGSYSGWEGLYALNLRVGPSFAAPMMEASASGITIKGTAANPVTLEMTATGGDYVKMSPIQFDPTYSSLGILVSNASGSSQTWHVSRGVVAYEGTRQIAALARNPNWAAGEVVLYGPTGVEACRMSATENGFHSGYVRVSTRYDVGTYNGQAGTYNVALAGGGSVRLQFLGGLFVGLG